jgi:ATP-binding cassette, subfamily F, member 3
MIKTNNLSKSYTGTPVFKDINFIISKNEVIALVGENGVGKTTLLRILAGDLGDYEGNLNIENEIIGYMPQVVTFNENMLVGEFLEQVGPIYERYKIDSALHTLGFENLDEYQKASTLSGGEKTKLYLASLMVKDPTILLLDEPTNNLDTDGIIAIQNFFNRFRGKVIVVSHDRAFLNAVASRIFELENGIFKEFVGNYSSYFMQKEANQEIQHKAYINWLKKKQQLEDLIVSARRVAAAKGGGGAVGAAKKRYEREVVKREVSNPFEAKKTVKLGLEGSTHSGKFILGVNHLHKKIGEHEILSDVDFDIFGNQCVWLYGKNGTGKTTIMKEIYDQMKQPAEKGSVKIGTGLNIGYYAQTQDILDPNRTLQEELRRLTNIDWVSAITMLGRLGFNKVEWDRNVSGFSFGQKARLIFGAFSLGKYNFLILDEPTNHLDIKTREIIEEALTDYKGAMLLVTHDRYFVERLGVNRILTLQNGTIVNDIPIN